MAWSVVASTNHIMAVVYSHTGPSVVRMVYEHAAFVGGVLRVPHFSFRVVALKTSA